MRKIHPVWFTLMLLTAVQHARGQVAPFLPADFAGLKKFFSYTPSRKIPLLLAHRGGPMPGYPENSLEAFRHTATLVPEAIQEMDVRMTQDSVLVMLHDNTLDRTTTGKGLLDRQPHAVVSTLQLRDETGKLTAYGIPLFENVLTWAKGRVLLAIDAKPGVDLNKVIHTIQKTGTAHQLFVICYSVEDAKYVLGKNPELMIALGFNSTADLLKIKNAGIPFGNLIALTPAALQEKSFYDEIHQMGILCAIGTYGKGGADELPEATAATQYQFISQKGIDIITTDKPVVVDAIFKSKPVK